MAGRAGTGRSTGVAAGLPASMAAAVEVAMAAMAAMVGAVGAVAAVLASVAAVPAVAAAALLAAPAPAAAQQAPPIVAVANGDSVRIFVVTPPPGVAGFHVYGPGPGGAGAAGVRLTDEPVEPEVDPGRFAETLGADLAAVMRAATAADVAALMRTLQTDPFAAGVLTYLYPSVAQALGRTWAEGGRAPGADVSYRVEFLDAGGAPLQSVETRVRMVDVLPAAPSDLRPDVAGTLVKLTWSYPRATGSPTDLAFGFSVYRTDAGSAGADGANEAEDGWVRISASPVLRDQQSAPVFEDAEVAPGDTYRYQVRAVDLLGREGPPSGATAVTIVDRVAPTPPARLTAEEGDHRVTLVWPMSPEPDAVSYDVERSTGLDKVFLRLNDGPIPVEEPSWVDTTATGGTQFFYRVLVADRNGNVSVPSNPISTLPVDRTPPPPPTDLVVRAEPVHHVRLTWTGASSGNPSGYHVYRGEGTGAPIRVTPRPVPEPLYLDLGPDSIGLEPGRRYYYGVRTVDDADNESEAITADIAIPDDEAPEPATAFNAQSVLGRYAALQWSSSRSLDVASYELDRVDGAGAVTVLGTVAVQQDRSLRDTTVVLGGRYVYRIVAVDTAGNRGLPASDSLWFRDDTPPSAPRNTTARAEGDGVVVAWERVADPDLDGYMVYRSELPTGVFAPVTETPVRGLTFTDAGAASGLYYVVRAVDTSGNESKPSPPVRAPDR